MLSVWEMEADLNIGLLFEDNLLQNSIQWELQSDLGSDLKKSMMFWVVTATVQTDQRFG
jgi:hypothetical protein